MSSILKKQCSMQKRRAIIYEYIEEAQLIDKTYFYFCLQKEREAEGALTFTEEACA